MVLNKLNPQINLPLYFLIQKYTLLGVPTHGKKKNTDKVKDGIGKMQLSDIQQSIMMLSLCHIEHSLIKSIITCNVK